MQNPCILSGPQDVHENCTDNCCSKRDLTRPNEDVLVVPEDDDSEDDESPVLAVKASLLKAALDILGEASTDTQDLTKSHRRSVYRLPPELIQDVYNYLTPDEFHNARYTCRLWHLASENQFVLTKMFKKAGWWCAMQKELQQLQAMNRESGMSLNESWFMSKRLARETNLSKVAGLDAKNKEESSPTNRAQTTGRPVALTYKTDFFQLGSTSIQACSLKFFTSACGKFILIADGCKIYVYELYGERLLPVTSILCPHKVLALSMNTSYGRYAIGALLSGRQGVTCDIELRPLPLGWQPCQACGLEENDMYIMEGCHNHPKLCAYHSLQLHDGLEMNVNDWDNQGFDAHDCSTYVPVDVVNGSIDPPSQTNRYWPEVLVAFKRVGPRAPPCEAYPPSGDTTPNFKTMFAPKPLNQQEYARGGRCEKPPVVDRLDPESPIPLSPATLSMYHNICNPEDYPLSVAICPTRRCVAFGCSSGIELHWRDWHSGKNFVKWIPLTVPSDFLYFVPPQPFKDKLSKLRLISSPAAPQQRSKLGTFEYDIAKQAPGRNSSEGWRWLISSGHVRPTVWEQKSKACFFQAIPVSDGQKFVFTEPWHGTLCLGHETSHERGIRLLNPVIFFAPPAIVVRNDKSRTTMPVRTYAVALNLSWGLRIAAVYDDSIVLYSVPSDMYAYICKATGSHCNDDVPWFPNGPLDPNIIIDGVYVGQAEEIVDICIQAPIVVAESDPSFAIWAFTRSGVALTYQFVPYASGTSSSAITYPDAVQTRVVQTDGRVTPVNQAQYDEYVAVSAACDPMDLDPQVARGGCDGANDSCYGTCEDRKRLRWWLGTKDFDKIMVEETPWEVTVFQCGLIA